MYVLNPVYVRVFLLCSVQIIGADQLQILSPATEARLAPSGRAVFLGAGHLSVHVKVSSPEKVRGGHHDNRQCVYLTLQVLLCKLTCCLAHAASIPQDGSFPPCCLHLQTPAGRRQTRHTETHAPIKPLMLMC